MYFEPGLTAHGLRHSHKTWLIADLIPDVAQAKRLGHRIPDKIEHIYSHVAPEVETRLLDALQRRWNDALLAVTGIQTDTVPSFLLGAGTSVFPGRQSACGGKVGASRKVVR